MPHPIATHAWLVLLVFAMGHTFAAAGECLKSVRWADDVPYSYRTSDGQLKGLNVELINQAMQSLHCDVRWLEMPWARALVELRGGRLDILPGARQTEERAVYAYFSIPVNRSPNVLFTTLETDSKYRLQRLDDIIGTDFRLGVQIGASYSKAFDLLSQMPTFQQRLTPITSRRNGWKMMEIGRIDGLISDEITAMVELQELGLLTKIVANKAISTGDPAHIMFSKASVSKDFVSAFDRTVQGMIADGRYKKIRQNYVPCQISADGIGCR